MPEAGSGTRPHAARRRRLRVKDAADAPCAAAAQLGAPPAPARSGPFPMPQAPRLPAL